MKTALITGASSGIGAASARGLSRKGFRVCLMARREDKLRELVDAINRETGSDSGAIYFVGDVTSETDRLEALEFLKSNFGHVDVLLNNAGYALPAVAEELNLDAFRKMLEVNVFACIAWMQMLGPLMRERRSGRIINMSSISGLIAFPGLGAYSASKYAIEAISDAARREYAPWQVKVILIEPGSVVTEIWETSRQASQAGGMGMAGGPFEELYQLHSEHAAELSAGKGPSADIVVRAVVHAATARKPKLRYCMPMAARIAKVVSFMPTWFQDWFIARSLKSYTKSCRREM